MSWSYTALTSFETCPWRHYLIRVKKSVADTVSTGGDWGLRVHDALAKRLQDKAPLPETMKGYEPIVQSLENRPGVCLVERKLTLNDKFEPVDWFARDAWLRVVLDVAIIHQSQGALFDYKTGKYKPDNDQLALFAGVSFCQFPTLQQVDTAFIWLQDGRLERDKFTRSQAGEIWARFLPRVRRMELAFANNDWPKKPSGLCRKHCPVGRGLCEHCGS